LAIYFLLPNFFCDDFETFVLNEMSTDADSEDLFEESETKVIRSDADDGSDLDSIMVFKSSKSVKKKLLKKAKKSKKDVKVGAVGNVNGGNVVGKGKNSGGGSRKTQRQVEVIAPDGGGLIVSSELRKRVMDPAVDVESGEEFVGNGNSGTIVSKKKNKSAVDDVDNDDGVISVLYRGEGLKE